MGDISRQIWSEPGDRRSAQPWLNQRPLNTLRDQEWNKRLQKGWNDKVATFGQGKVCDIDGLPFSPSGSGGAYCTEHADPSTWDALGKWDPGEHVRPPKPGTTPKSKPTCNRCRKEVPKGQSLVRVGGIKQCQSCASKLKKADRVFSGWPNQGGEHDMRVSNNDRHSVTRSPEIHEKYVQHCKCGRPDCGGHRTVERSQSSKADGLSTGDQVKEVLDQTQKLIDRNNERIKSGGGNPVTREWRPKGS